MRLEPLPPSASSGVLQRRGLTLIELSAILCILGVITLVVLPYSCRAREGVDGRNICGENVHGLGISMKMYANDFGGSWPIPAFDESAVGSIDYTVRAGGGEGTPQWPSRTQPSLGGPGGARQLSTTRALWMLVRSGDVRPQQFISPHSGEKPDESTNIDLYYDFANYGNISYGYQVPFGPPETRPREGMDNRMAIVADRGPYVDASVSMPPLDLGMQTPASQLAPFNSRNHGGRGQHLAFADAHASFQRIPLAGIDYDNIYTVALEGEGLRCRTTGESPWMRAAPPLVTTDPVTGQRTSTDSVIFP